MEGLAGFVFAGLNSEWIQSVVSRPLKDAFFKSLPVVVAHALKGLVETE